MLCRGAAIKVVLERLKSCTLTEVDVEKATAYIHEQPKRIKCKS